MTESECERKGGKLNEKGHCEYPKTLPTFKGYTVDEHLREFRKVDPMQGIEFVKFDSPEGKELLTEYKTRIPAKPESINVSYPKEFGEIAWGLVKTTDPANAYHELLYDTKLRKEFEITTKQIKSAIWDAQFMESALKAQREATRRELKHD